MTYTLRTTAPASGHFWSFGPLPLTAPPVLMDASGARAYRIDTIGDHSALYALESFAEMLPEPDGGYRSVEMVECTDADLLPKFWMHPAVRNDPAEIIPAFELDGEPLELQAIKPGGQSPVHNDFTLDYASEYHRMRLWVRIMARSPVVHCEAVIATQDRLALNDGRLVRLEISAAERIIGSGLRLVQLGAGGVDLVRFSLACELDGSDDVDEAPTHFDEASAQAIRAAEEHPEGFWFLPAEWSGKWLGSEAVTSPRGREWREAAMFEALPFCSAIAANQGGSQDSLGATFSVPLWSEPDPWIVSTLIDNARDWALRPVHILEPGTIDPIDPKHAATMQTVARQPHSAPEVWHGQHLPGYGTRGIDGRTGHDEQHMADMPLFAAYACTGSAALWWVIESNNSADLAQKRPQAGWRNNGRGEGRTGYNMLTAGLLLGGARKAASIAHVEKRLGIASRLSSTRDAGEDAPARVLHLLSDPRLNCEQPCWQVYEEAQFAWSSWLLWTMGGSDEALAQAYRSGLAVATALWRQNGQWFVPYSVRGYENGKALPREQLRYPSPQVHFGGSWPLWWSGCGLHALVRAVATAPALVAESHREHIDRARQALAWLADQPAPNFVEPHMALHGIPVPPAPVG